MWMSPWANATIAGIVFVLLSVLDAETYSAWGWRIPFLLGALMACGMLMYYRSYISEAPVWKRPTRRTKPLREIFFGEHRGALMQVFVLMSGLWLFTYMAIPVLAGQLKADLHLSAQTISFLMMCATAVSALGMVGCGHLSTASPSFSLRSTRTTSPRFRTCSATTRRSPCCSSLPDCW